GGPLECGGRASRTSGDPALAAKNPSDTPHGGVPGAKAASSFVLPPQSKEALSSAGAERVGRAATPLWLRRTRRTRRVVGCREPKRRRLSFCRRSPRRPFRVRGQSESDERRPRFGCEEPVGHAAWWGAGSQSGVVFRSAAAVQGGPFECGGRASRTSGDPALAAKNPSDTPRGGVPGAK